MLDRIQPYESLDELLHDCPKDQVIGDNLIRAWSKINSLKYKRIVCSISGGSDSDIVLDICRRCDKDNKITYIWFDTGLEYQATKEHLRYLQEKYQIAIKPYKSIKPIPSTCREYGQPFLSKLVSEFIKRLQNHNFQWEDGSFDELNEKYPDCKSALEWWCEHKGGNSRFNISRNKWLKEFIIENPPEFDISNMCCQYAKKDIFHNLIKDFGYELNIQGVRKSEGGVRTAAYKNCFTEHVGECDDYRPVFWYKDENKRNYEKHFGITHSRCYTEYGLKRTGCAGCPFGKDFEFELQMIKKHEPNLFKAVNNIFGESYEYTRKYRKFVKMMNKREEERKNGRQMEIFDYL